MVWYSGQFYALFYVQNVIKVDSFTANVLVAWSLILGTGGFLFFGSLSDKIGRKPIILAGCLIAAITYFPVFEPADEDRQPGALQCPPDPDRGDCRPESCSLQFNPTGTAKFTCPAISPRRCWPNLRPTTPPWKARPVPWLR